MSFGYKKNLVTQALFVKAVVTPVVLATSLVSSHVYAQANNEVVEKERVAIEKIEVTARKVKENIQETPVAVSAFGSEALELRNFQSVSDVTNFVPNVQFDGAASESGGGSSSQISIRGIGQTDYTITVEPGVGLYLDGVYIGKSVGSLLDTVDLESVEVLRGPQGTLFGKNTIGGAILLNSKKPTDDKEFSAEVIGGNYGRNDIKLSGNLPITDDFRVRGSFASLKRDGHVDRILTGDTQGNKDNISGRIVADWDISDSVSASFAFDASKAREESAGQVLVGVNENALFASFHNTIAFPECNPDNDARFSNPNCVNSQYARDVDSLESTNTGSNQSDTDIFGLSATIDWELDSVDIKSITAYREAEVEVLQELTGIPSYRNDIGQEINLELFSQEFQFSGNAFNDRLNYLFGIYYGTEKGNQVFPVLLESVQFTVGGEIDNTSLAFFGQVGYKITDDFSITLGARYSDEEKSFLPQQQVDNVPALFQPAFDGLNDALGGTFFVRAGLPIFPETKVFRTDNEFTPSLTLDYKVNDSTFAYATYSQGFKSGGFTMRGFPPVIPGVTTTETDPNVIIPSFGPETAEVFELGLKSDLWDDRLRLNMALFSTDYEDLQLTANTGASAFVPVLINAGNADITGLEVEAILLPSDWLRLDFSAGYLDSEYTELNPAAVTGTGLTLDSQLPNAPERTATLGATIDLFDNENGYLFFRTDWSYKSEQFKTTANTPELRQDSYSTGNATLTYRPDDLWQITAGVTNITDEIVIVSGVANGGIGYSQAVVSRPREWFISFKYTSF